MHESDDVRSSFMKKLIYYIHERVCLLEEYYICNCVVFLARLIAFH